MPKPDMRGESLTGDDCHRSRVAATSTGRFKTHVCSRKDRLPLQTQTQTCSDKTNPRFGTCKFFLPNLQLQKQPVSSNSGLCPSDSIIGVNSVLYPNDSSIGVNSALYRSDSRIGVNTVLHRSDSRIGINSVLYRSASRIGVN